MGSKRVGSAHIEFSARTAKVVSGMDEAKKSTRQATQQMKRDVNDAKQSITLLGQELGVHMPRQLRGFVAQLPGVATAMSAAFTGVAVLGLGKMVFDVGEKIYDFAKKVKSSVADIQSGWEQIYTPIVKTGVELDIAGDKLENTLAKLERKPANNLKLLMDETRKSAIDLAASIKGVNKGIDEMLAKNSTSGMLTQLGQFVFGDDQASTDPIEKKIKGIQKQLERAQGDAADMADSATPQNAAAVALQVRIKQQTALADAVRGATKALHEEQEAAAADKFGPHDAAIDDAKDYLRTVKAQAHNFNQENQNAETQAQVNAIEQKKALAAAAKAAERAAFEKQKADMEAQLAARKVDHQVTVLEEYQFWQKMLETTRKGSLAQKFVTEKLGTSNQEIGKALEELLKKYDEANKKKAALDKSDDERMQRLNVEFGKALAAEADQVMQLASIYEKNKNDLKELGLQHSVAAGELSRHDAAQELATLHAATYSKELDRLKAKLVEVQGADYLDVNETAKAVADLKEKIATLEGTADKQREIDAWDTAQTTAFGGIRAAMDELAAKSLDVSGQMREAFTSALTGINDNLADKMLGKKTDWSKVFSGLANQGAHQAIGMVETGLFKSLGAKTADGKTEASALWVRMVGGVKAFGSEVKNGLQDLIPGASSDGSHAGGFFSKIASMVTSSLIPHAAGGPVSAGTAYLVGEHGPEPFFPGVSGSMATNAAMRAAAGGSGGGNAASYTVNVANGVTPEEMRMHVQSALKAFHPEVVASSVAAVQQERSRKPASRA